MTDLILKTMVPAILDKLKKSAPGYVDAFLTWLSKTVPSSIDAVTAAFRKTYADVTARIATWAALPETKTKLSDRVDKILTRVKTLADK
jgi:hypothetical protein